MSAGHGLPTRRWLVGGGFSLAALAAVPARAQTARYASIRVDVQPLIARGGGETAARLIAAVLPGKMAEDFGQRGGGGAGMLVARIDSLYLSPFADPPGVGFGSFGNIDTMEGTGVVLSGRAVVSTTPLRVTLPASYSGAFYQPDIDQKRIVSLCESFASWLSREI